MVAPISGARPIHSLTGPAMAVTAKVSAPTQSTTTRMALIQGEMPWRLPALISGASVTATTAAARIGITMALPIYRKPPNSSRKMPMVAA